MSGEEPDDLKDPARASSALPRQRAAFAAPGFAAPGPAARAQKGRYRGFLIKRQPGPSGRYSPLRSEERPGAR